MPDPTRPRPTLFDYLNATPVTPMRFRTARERRENALRRAQLEFTAARSRTPSDELFDMLRGTGNVARAAYGSTLTTLGAGGARFAERYLSRPFTEERRAYRDLAESLQARGERAMEGATTGQRLVGGLLVPMDWEQALATAAAPMAVTAGARSAGPKWLQKLIARFGGDVGPIPQLPIRRGREMAVDVNVLPPAEAMAAAAEGKHLKIATGDQLVGAPQGTHGARGLLGLRANYDQLLAEAGPEDFSWYPRSREGVTTLAGSNPIDRRMLAYGLGLTSPQRKQIGNLRRTTTLANAAAAGAPIPAAGGSDITQPMRRQYIAARGLYDRAIAEGWTPQRFDEELRQGAFTGPKTHEYGLDLSPDSPYSTASVKDIWNLRGWGFPEDYSVHDATHRFISGEMVNATVRRYLREHPGGALPPDLLHELVQSTQSGPWVIQKARTEVERSLQRRIASWEKKGRRGPRPTEAPRSMQRAVAEARETVREVWPQLAARVTPEGAPWQLAGMTEPGTGHDVFLKGAGFAQGPTRPSAAVVGGEARQAQTALPLVGLLGHDIDPVSRSMLRQTEAARSLLGGGSGSSWSYAHATAGGPNPALRLPLRQPLSSDQLTRLDAAARARGLEMHATGESEVLFTQPGGDRPVLSNAALGVQMRPRPKTAIARGDPATLHEDVQSILGQGAPRLQRTRGQTVRTGLFPETPEPFEGMPRAEMFGPEARQLERDRPSLSVEEYIANHESPEYNRLWIRPDGRVHVVGEDEIHGDLLSYEKGGAEGMIRYYDSGRYGQPDLGIDAMRAPTAAQRETISRLAASRNRYAHKSVGFSPTFLADFHPPEIVGGEGESFTTGIGPFRARVEETIDKGIAALPPEMQRPIGWQGDAPLTGQFLNIVANEQRTAPRTAGAVLSSPGVRALAASRLAEARAFAPTSRATDPRLMNLWDIIQTAPDPLQRLKDVRRLTPWMLPAVGGLLLGGAALNARQDGGGI